MEKEKVMEENLWRKLECIGSEDGNHASPWGAAGSKSPFAMILDGVCPPKFHVQKLCLHCYSVKMIEILVGGNLWEVIRSLGSLEKRLIQLSSS